MKRSTPSMLTATAVATALLLSACGGSGEADEGGAAAGAEADEAPEGAEGAQETAAGQSAEAGEAASGTRTVTDAAGNEVEVPADPQRVVTLHYAATQPMYDLGLMPVGQGEFNEGIVPEDVLGELSEVPVVTEQGEPMLEEIALLDPDLILAPNTTSDDLLENLGKSAPVYVFTLRGGDRANWQQRTEEIADAINKSAELETLQADFEARQEEIASTYADQIEGATVAVIGA